MDLPLPCSGILSGFTASCLLVVVPLKRVLYEVPSSANRLCSGNLPPLSGTSLGTWRNLSPPPLAGGDLVWAAPPNPRPDLWFALSSPDALAPQAYVLGSIWRGTPSFCDAVGNQEVCFPSRQHRSVTDRTTFLVELPPPPFPPQG